MALFNIKTQKEDVLDILFQSSVQLTARAYIKKIKARFSVNDFQARKIVKQLIYGQELSYHYLYGSTYIEKSFLKPVQVTKNFILKPPGYTAQLNQKAIELIIAPGISFGCGQHPSTRLCLAAIDFCFFEKKMIDCRQGHAGADIGTGSGVLAMAMCLSGLASCNAYEIDPVSINEAKKNISLNHLTKNINIIEDTIKEGATDLSILSANLRFPTLKKLSDTIYASLIPGGIAILSGVREWEKESLVKIYSRKGFKIVWQQDTKKWSGFVLAKKVC